MASIARQPNGRRMIQFTAPDGTRKTIRLGKTSQRVADAIKVRVEQLNAAAIAGHAPDDETSRWVAGLDSKLADKLAAVGLIPQKATSTLGNFLDSYIESRKIRKPNTLRNYECSRRHLIDYFGEDKGLRDITPGDADDWRACLQSRYSEATVSREVKRARQFFRAAVRKKLFTENPFSDLPAPQQVNKTREYYITKRKPTRCWTLAPTPNGGCCSH